QCITHPSSEKLLPAVDEVNTKTHNWTSSGGCDSQNRVLADLGYRLSCPPSPRVRCRSSSALDREKSLNPEQRLQTLDPDFGDFGGTLRCVLK
ncbi:hypothetical protein STEG23_016860, partial [Scotinomys teguina]